MEPSQYLVRNGLSIPAVAKRLEISRSQFWKLLRGMHQADADIVAAFAQLSDGAVTAEDWHAVRLAYLRSVGRVGSVDRGAAGAAMQEVGR